MTSDAANLASRLKELETLPPALVVRRTPGQEEIVVNEPPVGLVPVPRRSRIFLRHGGGHGTFADLTLTAPIVRSYLR